MKKIANILILILLCNIFNFSQEVKNEPKIAGVNTQLFKDENEGIIELVDAYKKRMNNLRPLINEINEMATNYNNLRNEILQPERAEPWESSFYDKEIKRLNKLRVEIEKKKDILDKFYKNQEAEIIEPVNKKIAEALDKYAKENGYAIVIDTYETKNYFICGEIVDITKEFIKYYNSSTNVDNK